MASGLNGALLALGVVGVVAAAGRVVRGSSNGGYTVRRAKSGNWWLVLDPSGEQHGGLHASEQSALRSAKIANQRGSLARDWRPDARHLLALSEEEGEVDSGDLSDLLERIVEDRSVTGYPRSRAVRLLLDAQEEGYLDTGDALGAIQEALQSGSRSVHGGARYVAVVAGQPVALPSSVSHSYERSRDYARKTYGVDHVELVAGKGGSRSVHGMSRDAAGRALRLGNPVVRSHGGEALADYRHNPARALAQYTASLKKKKGRRK